MGSCEDDDRFWERTALEDMTDSQWEALCDGCGRCCLQKLEDIDTAQIYFTDIACQLLDLKTCRCGSYSNRFSLVPDCTQVRPLTAEKKAWLPPTCAYKLLADQQPLPQWHPLISGDPQSVHLAGISVCNTAVSENEVASSSYQEHIIEFPETESEKTEH